MGYLGRTKPSETTSSVLRSTYTGNGSTTTYALPGPVANETSIIATINGVTQQDAAYSTDGSNIIFDAAPASGDSIEIRTLSAVAMSYAPMAGSVVTGIIADGAVTTDKINNASVTGAKLGTGAAVANIGARAITAGQMPAGTVLQVVSTTKTDAFSTTSSSYVDVTGLSVSITPSSSSSKILVLFQINGSQNVGAGRAMVKLLRNSTVINAGDAAGSRTPALGGFSSPDQSIPSTPVSGSFLDSPATTSSTTYKIQLAMSAGEGSAYINQTDQDADQSSQIRTASTITVMEIAA